MDHLIFDGESLITPDAIAAELRAKVEGFHYESLETAKAELAIVLNIARQQFERGATPAGIIDRTAAELHKTRGRYHPAVWQELIPVAQQHSVAEYFLEDPFTRWSFDKPRGYSGDAHLLDFIYGHPDVAAEVERASPLGLALYEYTRNASSSVAVRERRDLLAKKVDEIADERGASTEILTVAAGHLREADFSVALREQRVARWVALDQDPLSIGSIARDFRGTCIEAVDGSVRRLLGNGHKLGGFDFVYAAGLYDYLATNVAVKLTQACMRMLKPRGVFLFANFAENIGVDAYMETFMNWALLLRSEADMWRIVNASVDRNEVDASVFFGTNRNIVYGVIRKRH